MLKVTDRLLAAKPDLLAAYVEVAKGTGTGQQPCTSFDCLLLASIPTTVCGMPCKLAALALQIHQA